MSEFKAGDHPVYLKGDGQEMTIVHEAPHGQDEAITYWLCSFVKKGEYAEHVFAETVLSKDAPSTPSNSFRRV